MKLRERHRIKFQKKIDIINMGDYAPIFSGYMITENGIPKYLRYDSFYDNSEYLNPERHCIMPKNPLLSDTMLIYKYLRIDSFTIRASIIYDYTKRQESDYLHLIGWDWLPPKLQIDSCGNIYKP